MKQPDLFEPADPFRLHRIHAAPASGRGGVSFDLGPFRWRPDGGAQTDHKLARAIAYRIAFTWNAAEGIPLPSLEAGYLREFSAAALELAEGVLASASTGSLIEQARRLVDLEKALDIDVTGGRLSDCPRCAQLDGSPDAPADNTTLTQDLP